MLNRAGAFVIASRMNTSPNALTEAHAIGLPVIGTRAGGIPEMIEEGKDGMLEPVDDADAMADRMQRLLAALTWRGGWARRVGKRCVAGTIQNPWLRRTSSSSTRSKRT